MLPGKAVKHDLLPPVGVRCQLKGYVSGAVEVALIVHDHACRWVGSVVEVKGEEHVFRPVAGVAGGHLKDNAAAIATVGVAAVGSGTVQVPRSVEDEAAIRLAPIRVAVLEAAQYCLGPAAVRMWGELKNRPVTIVSASAGCPIQVVVLIEGQAA